MSVLVFGHKNPDTDSICAAIAVADLKSKLGLDCKPTSQGELTPESKFVLDKFGLSAPETVTSVAGQKVILVDHSDLAQSPDDLKEAEILGIIDHHKLGDVTTPNPLECWIWPVGCTCTVIKAMYDFYGVEIPKNIAGAMLCAILSDTVIFKSATCTEDDKKACEALAGVAGISDMTALGMEMFKVKSAVDKDTPRDLLFRDYKDFSMGGNKVGIGQLEVVDLSIVEPVKDALYEEMKKVKEEGGRNAVYLMLTDIMKEGTELLVLADDPAPVQKAFGKPVDGNSVWLDGVMSRKKQVVPNFEKAYG
ncbi:manganese-dependent inorganic pyrophosphatase [Desulfonatronospira sp.]|uniref:manganese-dependent inorganic pyrophosphatase n=1 Tax=Desulfonatronospira sp. TaxID=1962951 RepID=UPI0025BCF39D|nr:manganese-dependent inorganic pyrophosphatase [Desulfonatronospira sp.]